MPPLRYSWVWWTLGWLLVAGVAVGSLMPGSFVAGFSARDKLLHAGSYLLLMVWFSGLYHRERLVLIASLLFVFGFALDLAQNATPSRVFDLRDVAANAGGILVGLVLARFVFVGWCQRVEQLFINR
jgi:hypothetical protein